MDGQITFEDKTFCFFSGMYIRESDKNVKLISRYLANDYFGNNNKPRIIGIWFLAVFIIAFIVILFSNIDEKFINMVNTIYLTLFFLIGIPVLISVIKNAYGEGGDVLFDFSNRGIEIRSKRDPKKDYLFIESSNLAMFQLKEAYFGRGFSGLEIVLKLNNPILLTFLNVSSQYIILATKIEYRYKESVDIILEEIFSVLKNKDITKLNKPVFKTVEDYNDELVLEEEDLDLLKEDYNDEILNEENLDLLKEVEEKKEQPTNKYLFDEFYINDNKISFHEDLNNIDISLTSGNAFLFSKVTNFLRKLINIFFSFLFVFSMIISITLFLKFIGNLSLSASHIYHEPIQMEMAIIVFVITAISFIMSFVTSIKYNKPLVCTIDSEGIQVKTYKNSIFIKKYDIEDICIRKNESSLNYDMILKCVKNISLYPISKHSSKEFILLNNINETHLEKLNYIVHKSKKLF